MDERLVQTNDGSFVYRCVGLWSINQNPKVTYLALTCPNKAAEYAPPD